MKTLRSLAAGCVVAGGLVALSVPAFAAGGDSPSTPTCPRGKVYDQAKMKCVEQSSGLVDDNSLLAYAATMSRVGRYDEALHVLDLLADPNTPVALNYRGYATRKLGRLDEGIGYYLKSVALDPDYTLVREYLGEAYVIQGKLDLAKQQLGEIEKRCGTTCESYGELAEAIQAAKT